MVREQWALAAMVAVVVASLATAFFAAPLSGVGSTTSSSTTTTTTTTAATSSTASTTISTTSANGFSFSPSEPLQVLSVGALTFRDNASSGKVYLTLSVLFKNVGSSAVYITKGCGSPLSAGITATSVISEIPGPRCLCAEYISPLDSGDSFTALTPGCWSGVNYEVVHPGTIFVEMTLTYYGGQNLENSGKTTIQASFTLE